MKACIHRPDESNMRRLLAAHERDCAGLALRLAYFEGLSRAELCSLRFADVDFEKKCLRVQGREIPLSAETEKCLLARKKEDFSPVLLSDHTQKPLTPEGLSHLVRTALDSVGERETRLADLRHDYVLRRFAELPLDKALAVTGLKLSSYESCYLPYCKKNSPPEAETQTEDKLFLLWKLLQEERNSPAGIALWLTWQMGLTQREIAALTWAQVDFGANKLRLPKRELPLTSAVRRVLAEEQRRRKPSDDPHVILSKRARKGVDAVRLSKLMRETLLASGLGELPARSLRRRGDKEDELQKIEALAREQGVAREDVMALLSLGPSAATQRLRFLLEQGKLLRVGGKYYPRDSVVPPEEQYETLQTFLAENGAAYLEDIARLFGIQKRQCSSILRGFVREGKLCLKEKRYDLPQNRRAENKE